MRSSIQIVHQPYIHKKHLHRYINNKGLLSLNHIMRRVANGSGNCARSRCNPSNSGGSLKNSSKQSHRPLHFKSLF